MQQPHRFSQEQLINGIRRLGKDRLIEECEATISEPPKGKRLRKMSATELASIIVENSSPEEIELLAAEGMQRQRIPSVGGPSWAWNGDGSLNATTAQGALVYLGTHCPPQWTEIEAELEGAELFGGIVYVRYTDWTVQPTAAGLVPVPSRNTALLLLDYEDQVFTVSAKSKDDSFAIGAAWAEATGSPLSPIELTLKPSIIEPSLSTATLRMLEAVYGRIGVKATVINIDRVRTRRHDPNSPVRWQTARGEDNHVLVDEDVRLCLRRGDDLVGVSFQLDWTYPAGREERHFITHVTLTASEGPFILRVTRGGHRLELASSLYVELRRALLQATNQEGIDLVKGVVKQDILPS